MLPLITSVKILLNIKSYSEALGGLSGWTIQPITLPILHWNNSEVCALWVFSAGSQRNRASGDNRNKQLTLVFFLAFLTSISHFLYLLYFSFWGHVSNYWQLPFFSLCFQRTPSMTGRTTCVPGASNFIDITWVRIKHDSYLGLSKQMVWSEII